jgi:hypothetical protein
LTGYLHPLYARALAEFGTPIELKECGGWLLSRPVPNSSSNDAMGCYPLFCCQNWTKLGLDLDGLASDLVSAALVVDPFADATADALRHCFQIVRPFKQHYLVDLHDSKETHGSRHHRYYTRKALQSLTVECAEGWALMTYLEEWVQLYNHLIQRHHLTGVKRFSPESFRRQFEVPGLLMFVAKHNGQLAGAHLWFVQGQVGYSHLAAANDIGYNFMASYAMYSAAIDFFKERQQVRWLNLGAGAGISAEGKDGLAEFKRGWSNSTRTTHFCGKIFDADKYSFLARANGIPEGSYFPSYRQGEFA